MDEKSDSDQELAAPSYTAEPTGLAREQVAPGTGAYMQQERVGSAEPDGLQVSMPQNFTMAEAGISETYADSDGVWTPTTGFGHVSGSFQDVIQPDDHHQVKELMMTPDADGQKILHWAAATGCLHTFETVLSALGSRLDQGEVEHLLAASTAASTNDIFSESRTVLNSAASSGGSQVFVAVLDLLERCLSAWQVKRMMIYQDMDLQENLLHSAINSRSTNAFDTVLSSVTSRLTPTEARNFLLRADDGKTLLHAAAGSGSKDMFEAVLSTLLRTFGPEKVQAILTSKAKHGKTILQFAAQSGNKESFGTVLAAVKGTPAAQKGTDVTVWSSRSDSGRVLCAAASSGSRGTFEAALGSLELELPPDEVRDAMRTSSMHAELLVAAAKSGSIELWQAVVNDTREGKALGQAKTSVVSDDKGASLLLRTAASQGTVRMWEAVRHDLLLVQPEQVLGFLSRNSGLANVLVKGAVRSRDPSIVGAVIQFVHCTRLEQGVLDFGAFIGSGFSDWTTVVLEKSNFAQGAGGGGLDWAIGALSCLLQYPTMFDTADLIQLSRERSAEWLRTCFLETVACSDNPFVPGMTLSIAFAKSASVAPEGERRKLLSLQERVDTLLLEILERLPQTVQGFDGGMTGCSAVFEPELSREDARGLPGPLRLALQERQHVQTFCTQPLLTDFLSRRFTYGLPGLRDTQNILGDRRELTNLARGGPGELMSGQKYLALDEEGRRKEDGRSLDRCLLLDLQDKIGQEGKLLDSRKIIDTLLSPCILLQGANCAGLWNTAVSLTFLPGAQFTIAGLVGMPDQYYRVPAMRMLLDLAVYLGMLVFFSTVVLFHEDGPLTPGEAAFAFYILAGIITEGQEMRRDFGLYAADHWNILDLLGLGLVTGGLIVRCADGDNSWGRALYALSAPLIFSRLLFFAQMLRFHGPMIQVVFSMTAELVKFGVVIIVVMLGFAMSFHALFGDVDTFGGTCLTLFKAMLGEVDFFGSFPGNQYDSVATALFVIYLVVIAVMLLNLLIAVLSTSHSKVEGKADQEFKVSKARIIEHYRMVVDMCLLPPPFNLVQLILSLPVMVRDRSGQGTASTRAQEAVGRMAFWLALGPVAAACGTVLWVLSSLFAPFVWHTHFYSKAQARRGALSVGSLLVRYLIVFFWCVLGAPLYLMAFWLTAPMKWLKLRPWCWVWDRRQAPYIASWNPKSVNDLLEGNSGGLVAGDLQMYLEDPIGDPEVRPDERRKQTTVENIKQLRNRLEKTILTHLDAKLDSIEQDRASSTDGVQVRLARMEENLAGIRAQLDDRLRRVEEHVSKMQEQVDERIDRFLSIVEQAVDRRNT
ncbi:Ankyrin Repeat Transient Receptor Potential Channel [Ectocarpus siliculosus]|uniref:Ankyrin Repeat Transient Receptor Potential Channel n=1 Tax=Ectocarpus siliculosus TaxID=2880 RepID=D7FLB1_ECTSI|nr:Ankyrin Repeat Transient Receptor Potential Channel [Ectocarpus siliculosus]|eukprot:CBJ29682.1 Ankyrin Repeat Transient Receptor Potential Channel [Ectocarpus siliculosus]